MPGPRQFLGGLLQIMANSDPYAANTGGPANPAREKLVALRLSLLGLHKELLDMERRDYERLHGKVNTGELFRLVIDHEQFAWLHNISEFVVRIDESLAAENPITGKTRTTRLCWHGRCFRRRRRGMRS